MKTFETVSFHIIKPCNMKCKFCYATFDDMHVPNQLTFEQSCIILDKLRAAGVEKVTFAGGEPMLYKHLDDCIVYAKSIGFTTSIITNGSMITRPWLNSMKKHLDWIGLSIDSLNSLTNKRIGRVSNKVGLPPHELTRAITSRGYKLKINTVVNRYNQNEKHMKDFVENSKAIRWKVFDTLRVEGQNDEQFEEIKSTKFYEFIKNNHTSIMVPEPNELMIGAYLLVDPTGRLFDDTQGKHTYSSSLLDKSMAECLAEVSLDRETFIKRGGIYEW